MKIAQVAPLYESVPPKLYGGTERVGSYLAEELVRQGHDVTLFASADSVTKAKLHPVCDRALRLEGKKIIDPVAHHIRMIELVAQETAHFDIVQFHTDYLHFPVTRRQKIKAVTTLHGRLDIPDLVPLYLELGDMNLVSISNSQRLPLVWANWVGRVYHGLPEDLYKPVTVPGKYLASSDAYRRKNELIAPFAAAFSRSDSVLDEWLKTTLKYINGLSPARTTPLSPRAISPARLRPDA
jgi:glycosyltransferase involved in cell wall biosynthesis